MSLPVVVLSQRRPRSGNSCAAMAMNRPLPGTDTWVLGWSSTLTIAAAATIKPLVLPSTDAEPGYRPSAALAQFVRCRDVTCRFPGCDQPAEHADIDHTVPWPLGPTHPSKLCFACGCHRGMASRGEFRTEVTDSGRLGWPDGTRPPEVNHAHHPEELFRDEP